MPIPKEKQKLYGKIIGIMINLGKGKKKAKAIADKAVVDDTSLKETSKKKKGNK